MSPEFNEKVDETNLDIFVERALIATTKDESVDVLIRFWKPMARPKGGWLCLYKIIGVGDEKLHYAAGIDSIQSLQLAMYAVGAELSGFPKEWKLTFLGENHFGFPCNIKEATGSCPYCMSGEAE
jgi:hypothetical protein